MPVQDDERERELVRLFNLEWDPAHQRGGVDAMLEVEVSGNAMRFEIEVKSTTGTTVSTARDVGMAHIQKWRHKFFIIGYYTREARRPELRRCLCLTPLDMEPWISSIESKISIDFKLALRASRRLALDDLFDVCGQQSTYSVEDAKRLHKQQWSAAQYAAAPDIVQDGRRRISHSRMLEILQLRSQYIAERGATLNNPHISKAHLSAFQGTDRIVKGPNWAADIRRIAATFASENPGHAAVLRSAGEQGA